MTRVPMGKTPVAESGRPPLFLLNREKAAEVHMKSEFLLAFNQICNERNLPKEVVLEALNTALVSAYRRDVNASSAQNITAVIDGQTGLAHIYAEKEVTDEVTDLRTEVA